MDLAKVCIAKQKETKLGFVRLILGRLKEYTFPGSFVFEPKTQKTRESKNNQTLQ